MKINKKFNNVLKNRKLMKFVTSSVQIIPNPPNYKLHNKKNNRS